MILRGLEDLLIFIISKCNLNNQCYSDSERKLKEVLDKVVKESKNYYPLENTISHCRQKR